MTAPGANFQRFWDAIDASAWTYFVRKGGLVAEANGCSSGVGFTVHSVPDIDLAAHQPGFRPFLVRGEMWAYWTVYDGAYEPVRVADVYLRRLRFGSGMALGTTRMYASNLALFFEFCLTTGRSPRRAAVELDRFMHHLVVTPVERRGRGQGQLRSRERVNHILVAVRELYREAVAHALLGGEVLQARFRVQRGFRLPAGVVEGQELTWHARRRHQSRAAKRGRPATVAVEQFAGLMAACRTWRDRTILALLGTEHALDPAAQRLPSVDDKEDRLLRVQAGVDQVGQQHRHERGVLGRALPQPKRDLHTLGAYTQRDDVCAIGDLKPVEHHHREAAVIQPTLHQLRERGAGPFDEQLRNRRLRRRGRFLLDLRADRLAHTRVLPGRDAGEHPVHHRPDQRVPLAKYS